MSEPVETPTPGSHGRGRRTDEGREAVEDYAKAIYALSSREGGAVQTNAIAERLGVSAGTVSTMVKRMAERGLVSHQPYRGVELTDAGRRVALEVIRHHRLIESYLAEKLGMPWDRVHDEAEVLEHHISEELEERMAEALGDPARDPHGDPIPGRDLTIATDEGTMLSELDDGGSGVFIRISDNDPEMLRYLDEHGILPGTELEITGREPFGGPVRIRVAGSDHSVGPELARRMLISTS